MSREARLILPTHDNAGLPLTAAHTALRDELCDLFGGFTLQDKTGGFKSSTGRVVVEPVTDYTIAMEPSAVNADTLRAIAKRYAWLCRQESVYVCLPTGDVEFVEGVAPELAYA